jgi:hypothetical protein
VELACKSGFPSPSLGNNEIHRFNVNWRGACIVQTFDKTIQADLTRDTKARLAGMQWLLLFA